MLKDPWASYNAWDLCSEQSICGSFYLTLRFGVFYHPTQKNGENVCLQLFLRSLAGRWFHYCFPSHFLPIYFLEVSLPSLLGKFCHRRILVSQQHSLTLIQWAHVSRAPTSFSLKKHFVHIVNFDHIFLTIPIHQPHERSFIL